MKFTSILLSVVASVLFNILPGPPSSTASDLTESEIASRVRTLINSKGVVHVQSIKIEEDNQGQLSLEMSANLGNCWGKKEIAKGFVRDALKALYASNLPISHVILNVYGSDEALLTVALGKNQASNMNWDKEESLSSFYDRMKARINYKGNPADFCWLIEKNQGSNP